MSPIEQIKNYVSPVTFYRLELDGFKPVASDWVNAGLCPFHADTRPNSFFVNQKSGGFKCHSCGKAGGDVIRFVQLRDGCTITEAIAYFTERGYL